MIDWTAVAVGLLAETLFLAMVAAVRIHLLWKHGLLWKRS
jgi:hypothetical protein